ncbi:MAG TPA: XRE family transcriptional regulator [Streptosporangiaceae bacterium]|jgi:Zn-dependent peptidase ImmA (M78 family)
MVSANLVCASRLRLARKRRGLTLVRLAELTGISTRSLSAYEKGEQRPGPGRVGVIAARLGYPTGFFFGEGIDELAPAAVSFRAPSKLPAVRRDAALSAGRLAMEVNRWIVERFVLPEPDLPTLDRREPESAAEEVRARWGLGAAPVPNMVHLLEAHGVRVFSLPECAEVDAFSTVWDGTPYVFLNVGKSGERGRFDAAHELGHLVLHSERQAGPDAEREANRFAGAFLMPRASVLAHLPPAPSVERILTAKRTWQVAAMALTHRLYEVDLLSEWLYRTTCIELCRRGFRVAEPGGIQRESSQLLHKVFRALRTDRITAADIAADLRLPAEEVNGFLFGLVPTAVPGDRRGEGGSTGGSGERRGDGAPGEEPDGPPEPPEERPRLRIVR